METLELKILKVDTKIEKNRFERAHDVGNSRIFSIPKQFVVSYECETVEREYGKEPTKVYFTHRFNFDELISPAGGSYHSRKESEFVIYLQGKKETHMGGLRGDQEYYTLYGEFYSKFQEGERIRVKGSMEKKVSKVGKEYIQMKRVKLDRNYYFHALKAS